MAAPRISKQNAQLAKLRGSMSQKDFGWIYFGLALRTYQKYESTQTCNLPTIVQKLIRVYERHGLTTF